MSDTPKDKADFTPRELEIMAKAWTCMTEEPKVEHAKLAEACGMTNPRSASNAWTAIKKKIIAKVGITKDDTNDNGEGGSSPTKKTPKATPRKRTKKADAEAAGEDDDEESPAKKPKPTPKGKKGKAVKSEPSVEEDEEAGGDGDGEGKGKESSVKEEAVEED